MIDDLDQSVAHENLRQEYADVSSNLRHYSNLQFAQLTVYVAVAGVVLSRLYGQPPLSCGAHTLLSVAGGLMGAAFLLCSRRVSEYWNARVTRAKEIERLLDLKQYQDPVPMSLVSNRFAVSMIYVIVISAFVVSTFLSLQTATEQAEFSVPVEATRSAETEGGI